MSIRFPKNYNRCMIIKPDDQTEEGWMLIATGITSRASNFSETAETYYYMSGRGMADKEPTTQEAGYTYSGHRAVGDPAQDYALDEVLYDMEKRNIEWIEWDDGVDISGDPKPANGWRGKGTLQITDPGSGDATARQTIGFTINLSGKPEKGTLVYDAGEQTYTWTAKE